jgi:aldehyde dehydrogenase (NAD+)
MGPLIRPSALARVEGYVDATLAKGADVVTGARRPATLGGWFYEPTVLTGVDNTWPVAQEEIFGPVGVVIPVADDDEAVRVANDSPYGLSGAVFSVDLGAAYELASRLRTGEVNLNGGAGVMSAEAPFGGFKRSGLGRELGEAGLLEYCQTQTIKFHAG